MIITKLFHSVVPVAAPSFLLLFLVGSASANESSASQATAEFCSTIVQIESVLSSSVPLVVLPLEVAKQVAGYQLSKVGSLYKKAQELAPKDIAADVSTVATATTRALSTLDFSGTQTMDFAKADDSIDAKMLSSCDYEGLPVTAVNYEYLGIPGTLPSGETALTLTNKGDEVHEISIARINDDVKLSAKEILMLPEEESLAAIKLVSYAAVPPGGTETTFMNLDDGRYYAICFTPKGTMSFHTPGEGPPHFLHGMLKEFTVGSSAKSSIEADFNPSARSTPQELLALLGQFIDARDVDAILSIHEPDAGVVEWAGGVARGTDEIRQLYVDFFATKPNLKANARQVVEAGGVAIILGDYTLDFIGKDGKTISTIGKFGDIVRQQPEDGTWLYLLDNPYAP